jgi:hypothetical protein
MSGQSLPFCSWATDVDVAKAKNNRLLIDLSSCVFIIRSLFQKIAQQYEHFFVPGLGCIYTGR